MICQQDKHSVKRWMYQWSKKMSVLAMIIFGSVGLCSAVSYAAPPKLTTAVSSLSYTKATIAKKKAGVYDIAVVYPVYNGKSALAKAANENIHKDIVSIVSKWVGSDFPPPMIAGDLSYLKTAPVAIQANASLISFYLLRSDYDAGSSYGEQSIVTFNYGLINGKPSRFTLRDLFVKNAPISNWIIYGIDQKVQKDKLVVNYSEDWRKNPPSPDGFYLSKSAITLVYNMGSIAGRGDGIILIPVPLDMLTNYLNPEGPLKSLCKPTNTQKAKKQPVVKSVAKPILIEGLPDICYIKDRVLWLFNAKNGSSTTLISPQPGFEYVNPQWISHDELAILCRKPGRPGTVLTYNLTSKTVTHLSKLKSVIAIGYDHNSGILDFQSAKETDEWPSNLSSASRGEYTISNGSVTISNPYKDSGMVTGRESTHALDDRSLFTYNPFITDFPTHIGFVSRSGDQLYNSKKIMGDATQCILSICPADSEKYAAALCNYAMNGDDATVCRIVLLENGRVTKELARSDVDFYEGCMRDVCTSQDGNWVTFVTSGEKHDQIWAVPTDGNITAKKIVVGNGPAFRPVK